MLRELQIRNFALIEQLELSFYSGFSVLTGETGAGKSIIIDALGLLLGARASTDMIRSGSKSTEVSGYFLVGPKVQTLLESWGLGDGAEVIVSREINYTGRNKCWINGRLASVSQLAELGTQLVDIVGQHNHQILLSSAKHRSLLDAYGSGPHLDLVDEVERLGQQWKDLQAELNRFQHDERERNRQIDLLSFQVNEIENAHLQAGEEEELDMESARLANLDRIRQGIHFVLASLDRDSTEQESLLRGLFFGEVELNKAAGLDPQLQPLAERYSEAILNLDDLHRELRDYLEFLPADPRLLQEIETRLQLIDGLKRKYGETTKEILEYGVKAREELENLENAVTHIDNLDGQSAKLQKKWLGLARQLSVAREKLAADLEKRIESELVDLSMGDTRFKVKFIPSASDKPRLGGLEDVEFMMAANLGEELKPLVRVASGGELSRVMLAIKAILVEAEQIPTVVFDEIDAGIGGRTAVQLGEKLHSLSECCQILSVTHLPVLAGYATNHYSVRKSVVGERTVVNVENLTEEERIEELTRMLGGTLQETVTSDHARELLRKAQTGLTHSGI